MFTTLRNHSKIIVIIVAIAFVATGALMGFGSYLYGGGSSGASQTQNPNIAKVNSNLSSSKVIDFRLNVLNSIIERRLLLQKAEEKGITAEVDDKKVQSTVDDILKNYDMTKKELVSNLEKQGYSLDQFKSDLRKDLEQSNIIEKTRATTYNNISVSEDEIKKEYEKKKEQGSEKRKYEKAKSEIKQQLLQQKQNQAFNNWLKDVKSNANITIFDPILSGARAYQNNNYESAIKDFNKVMENKETIGPGTYIYLARSYKANKNNDKALEIYKKAAKEYPDNWEVHLKFGELYSSSDKKEKAIKQLDKAAELVSDNYMAHYQLYQGYNKVGAKEKAQNHMQKVQELSQKMIQQQIQQQVPKTSGNTKNNTDSSNNQRNDGSENETNNERNNNN